MTLTAYGITPADLIPKVREIAATFPDFVYRPSGKAGLCRYYPTPESLGHNFGCIIGEAARRITPEGFDKAGDNITVRGIFGCTLAEGREMTPEVKWLQYVQHRQDDGNSWSKAVTDADKHLPLT